MVELAVELYAQRLGTIIERGESWDFVVEPDAVDRFGVGSSVLSYAVPLLESPRRSDAPLRRNFFDELLPEGRARARLAGNALLSPDYTVGMLARYGRDVAGAVKVWNPEQPGEPRTPSWEPIDDTRVKQLLDEVGSTPLGNDSIRRMSSLAGVQDKIVLAKVDGSWAEPIDGYASTHILKPVVSDFPSLIFDEEFASRIVRNLGLAQHSTSIEQFAGTSALVIERYDRSSALPDGRVHQEDFNQALGMSGDGKYQDHGHPGLAAIARLLRTRIGRDAVRELLRLTTVSLAVGNYDMHAKNISVMHLPDGSDRLAPAYDVVPQAHLGFDPEFALAVNGVSDFDQIGFGDLVAESQLWGVRDAPTVIEETILGVIASVENERPLPGAHFDLAESIHRIASDLYATRDRATGTGRPQRIRSRDIRSTPGGWGGPRRS